MQKVQEELTEYAIAKYREGMKKKIDAYPEQFIKVQENTTFALPEGKGEKKYLLKSVAPPRSLSNTKTRKEKPKPAKLRKIDTFCKILFPILIKLANNNSDTHAKNTSAQN